MALVSPGVEVSIIDESNYLPAPTNSVPFILLATAENKISGNGTGVAPGTLAENANEVYLISSQRDLAATFGNPFFYSTTAGTSINGYELNEYGLLAAYSVLGVSNRAYVQRVNVDLGELVASLSRPTGEPENDSWWLDTSETAWGIFEWSSVSESFTNKTPIVITSADDLDSGVPKDSIGNIGDYAVVTTNANNPVYYKSPGNTLGTPSVDPNTWVLVGSDEWKNSIPTVISSETSPVLTAGNSIFLNDVEVVFSNTTVAGVATDIDLAGIAGVSAQVVNNRLYIYANSNATNDGSTADGNGIVDITAGIGTGLADLGIDARIYYAPTLQQSPHYQNPRWRSTDDQPHPTGSVWHKTTNVNNGANLVVKQYDSTLGLFETANSPLYKNDQSANKELDPSGGGRNIAVGTLYTQYDVNENDTYTVKLFERVAAGETAITGTETAPEFTAGDDFDVQVSSANSDTLSTAVSIELTGTTAADFVAAFQAANIPNTTATVTSTGAIQLTHTEGGVIVLNNTTGTPVTDAGFTSSIVGIRDGADGDIILSNWVALGGDDAYSASNTEPSQDPDNGRRWYYSSIDVADILVHDGTAWRGYQNVTSDVRGYDLSQTDPEGPIFSATAPIQQSDGSSLVYGDLWIDTSDLENYPRIYRWQRQDAVDQWILLDNTDNTSEDGILFADARWGTSGSVDPVTDDLPAVADLLASDYLDIDAPGTALYPTGMLLFNTRRSGFNVKEFRVDYFNAADFPDDVLPAQTSTWVTASGLKDDGSPYMGRRAVRNIVVSAMKAGIDGNTTLREEQRQFNLLSAPGYPEVIPNMIALNNERNNTGFVIGDAPLRLAADDNSVIDWATNANGAGTDSEDGLVTADPYLAVFYPACQTTDLDGSTVVQPASHMMTRTFVRSDEVSFPWLAPAGTRRGTVDNATALGYINSETGEFVQTAVRQGLRDILYENKVNPITFIPGSGILNYGNKTTAAVPSALDRVNVARLVAFIRERLETIGKNFVFEPNDQITRNELKGSIESLLNDLVAKRGVYDYLVVCDESNNTPSRIDRNELYVDIAIEPVKAVEFVYIPVRIKNTGEIEAGEVATSSTI